MEAGDWGLEPKEPGKPGDRGLEPREAGDKGLDPWELRKSGRGVSGDWTAHSFTHRWREGKFMHITSLSFSFSFSFSFSLNHNHIIYGHLAALQSDLSTVGMIGKDDHDQYVFIFYLSRLLKFKTLSARSRKLEWMALFCLM